MQLLIIKNIGELQLTEANDPHLQKGNCKTRKKEVV